MKPAWKTHRLSEFLAEACEPVTVEDAETYRQVTVSLRGRGVRLRQTIKGAEIKTKSQCLARAGQFIYSRIDARNGAMGIVPPELDGALVTGDFPTFKLNPEIVHPRFFAYLTSREAFIEKCREASRGVTNRKRLKEPQLLSIEVEMPPLPEQARLAARLDALAARLAEARRLHRQLAEEPDLLYQSVAAELLSACPASSFEAIGALADVRGGMQKCAERAPKANPRRYLTVAHVQRNRIDWTDERFFEVSEAELDRWRLLPGDVLVIEGNGSEDQIGRCALFHGEIADCVHQNHVIRIRTDRERLRPEFLNAFLNSPLGREEMKARSRTATGLYNLSVGRIRGIRVPVPPLATQQQLVAELAGYESKIAALQQFQCEVGVELDALMPALLDLAFKGEL